jgi:hypothetical protein
MSVDELLAGTLGLDVHQDATRGRFEARIVIPVSPLAESNAARQLFSREFAS